MASEFMTNFQDDLSALQWDEESIANGKPLNFLRHALGQGGYEFIRELCELTLSSEELLDQAEENPTLSRLVLYQCRRSNSKLRFHWFPVGSDARPHNHRWPFASCILAGGYNHTIYEWVHIKDKKTLKPLISYNARPGHAYVLSSRCLHRTDVAVPTASLVLQGPPDTATWKRYAASSIELYATKSTLNIAKRKLPRAEVEGLISELHAAFARLQSIQVRDDTE